MTFHLLCLLYSKTEKECGYNTNLFSVTEDPPPILIKTCKDRHLTEGICTVWQEGEIIAKIWNGMSQRTGIKHKLIWK